MDKCYWDFRVKRNFELVFKVELSDFQVE